MSVTNLLDTVTEWARQNICEQVMLKQPPADLEEPVDSAYEYALVHPAAFTMYVPTPEKLPPNIHAPYPSLCVQFVQGEDQAAEGSSNVDLLLSFAAWNPGIHGKDIFNPIGANLFQPWDGGEAQAYFKRTSDGWRDVWNFVDTALRAVESVTHIGAYSIDRSTPIKFGPHIEKEAIPDLYPYWFAWVSFRVTYPLRRNISDIQNLL